MFLTAIDDVLEALTDAQATREARRRTGQSLSKQAYVLAEKVLEAERWRRQTATAVWEVHPKVSFAVLLGRPARAAMRKWAGMQ